MVEDAGLVPDHTGLVRGAPVRTLPGPRGGLVTAVLAAGPALRAEGRGEGQQGHEQGQGEHGATVHTTFSRLLMHHTVYNTIAGILIRF